MSSTPSPTSPRTLLAGGVLVALAAIGALWLAGLIDSGPPTPTGPLVEEAVETAEIEDAIATALYGDLPQCADLAGTDVDTFVASEAWGCLSPPDVIEGSGSIECADGGELVYVANLTGRTGSTFTTTEEPCR